MAEAGTGRQSRPIDLRRRGIGAISHIRTTNKGMPSILISMLNKIQNNTPATTAFQRIFRTCAPVFLALRLGILLHRV